MVCDGEKRYPQIALGRLRLPPGVDRESAIALDSFAGRKLRQFRHADSPVPVWAQTSAPKCRFRNAAVTFLGASVPGCANFRTGLANGAVPRSAAAKASIWLGMRPIPDDFWSGPKEERIAKCRALAAEARQKAQTLSGEQRDGYARLADEWESLANELEAWNPSPGASGRG
jgi:hypothetical protein